MSTRLQAIAQRQLTGRRSGVAFIAALAAFAAFVASSVGTVTAL
jgi:hypothetical protein